MATISFDNARRSGTIRDMEDHRLVHLAIIAMGVSGPAGDQLDDIRTALDKSAAIAREAFTLLPELRGFSFVAPEIDSLLENPETATAVTLACVLAGRAFAGAAAESGAVLRLCGRPEGLPEELRAPALRSPAASGRTLLWFLRYSGREEVVQAASRFFQAHSGCTLTEDALDACLDTAGVPDPDLLIYTGESPELRDVLLWQGSYAEIWRTDSPWTSFTAHDLHRAVGDYAARQRRFGR